MKNLPRVALLSVTLLISASFGFAAQAKSYQVTGPIIALTDTVITVQKGDEKWEIVRSEDLKTDGELRIGSKVTIYYRMHGISVETKTTTAADAPTSKAGSKAARPGTPSTSTEK